MLLFVSLSSIKLEIDTSKKKKKKKTRRRKKKKLENLKAILLNLTTTHYMIWLKVTHASGCHPWSFVIIFD
jgi:energy-converting hydrogenase Eha subunit H